MAASDKYANVLTQEVTMSAADTLTFQEVNIGLSLFDKAGILISRVEYEWSASELAKMTAAGDQISMGITASNSLTTLAVDQNAVIHRTRIQRADFGAAASGGIIETPRVYDFSSLPGGGIMITPKPWYVAMTSNGLANACTGTVRFFFTIVKLAAQDYFELMETRAFFG